jgi:hypothetical protein
MGRAPNGRGEGALERSNVRLEGIDFALMFAHRRAFFGGLDLSGGLKMAVWLLERCRIG